MACLELVKTPYLGEEWRDQVGCLGKLRDRDYLELVCGTVKEIRCIVETINLPYMHTWEAISKLNDLFLVDLRSLHSRSYYCHPECYIWSAWESSEGLENFLKSQANIEILNSIKTNVYILRVLGTGEMYVEYIRKELPEMKVNLRKVNPLTSKTETKIQTDDCTMVFTTSGTESYFPEPWREKKSAFLKNFLKRLLRKFVIKSFVKRIKTNLASKSSD